MTEKAPGGDVERPPTFLDEAGVERPISFIDHPSAHTAHLVHEMVIRHDKRMRYGSITQYGACNTEEAFDAKINEWGGPRALLISSWVSLLPIIVPLCIVSLVNLNQGKFLMKCRKHDMWTLPRTGCDLTYPAVKLFPGVCRVSALGLLSYRLVRQRFFYVFLRRKMMIDFKNIHAPFIIASQLVLLSLVVVHICLMLGYGKERDWQGNETQNHWFPHSFGTFMANPHLLFEKQSRKLVRFVTAAVVEYIFPSFVAIVFFYWAGNVDVGLVGFLELYSSGPMYVHQHLSNTIIVSEDIAEKILDPDDKWLQRGANRMRTQISMGMDRRTQISMGMDRHNCTEVCELFREEALKFDGVYTLGAVPNMDRVLMGWKTAPKHNHSLSSALMKKWWHLEIILKDEPAEEDIQFRQAWCIHCALCIMVLCVDLVDHSYAMWSNFNWLGKNQGYTGLSTLVFLSVAVFFWTVVDLVAMFNFGKQIYRCLTFSEPALSEPRRSSSRSMQLENPEEDSG